MSTTKTVSSDNLARFKAKCDETYAAIDNIPTVSTELVNLGTLSTSGTLTTDQVTQVGTTTVGVTARASVNSVTRFYERVNISGTTATLVSADDDALRVLTVNLSTRAYTLSDVALGGGGTNVVANPTTTGTEDLTSLQVGETIYNVPATEIVFSTEAAADAVEVAGFSVSGQNFAFNLQNNNCVIGKTISNPTTGITYIKCTISGTVSATGNYYFVNCSGSITVSGTTAKVYVTDSPNFTVNGITSDNWINIFIDGVTSFGQATRFINGIQILKNVEYNNPNAPSEKTITFQIAFVSDDYIIAVAPNIADTDYKFYKAMPSVEHLSASQFKLKFVSFDGNDQVSPAVDYIAIGRWK